MIQIILGRRSFDGQQTNYIQATTREGLTRRDGAPIPAGEPICVSTISDVYKNSNEILDMLPEHERYDVFYCLAHHQGAGAGVKPARTIASFDHQTVLGIDVDGIDTQRILEYAPIVADALKVPVAAATVVNSGNGGHFIFGLKTVIRDAQYFQDNREAFGIVVDLITDKIKEAGLPGHADSNVFDAARIFRLPGSENRKPTGVKQSSLIQYANAVVEIDLKVVSGIDQREREHIDGVQVKRHYPKPDFAQIIKECRFADYVQGRPGDIHEPDFFLFLTLLAQCDPDATAETQFGQVTPHHLAELVFNHATGSVSLGQSNLEAKWLQAKKYGAPKCSTVNSRWSAGCEGCPHWSLIPTPLALKGKQHVGSESAGYWVRTETGNPKHPHYSDLTKIYHGETSYIVSEGARLFSFNGAQYKPMEDLSIKSWLENKLDPTDPIREQHRNEFLNKVKAVGAAKGIKTSEFFSESIDGKLNCKNGVLDIKSGKMLPHSPQYGFLYTLPYALDPDGPGSEIFTDWLSLVMGHQPELLESILDILAYTFWPRYDDHIFTLFSGEGSNGKSTLIHLIQAMVGKGNYSTASLQQLGGNRFISALLEGKLVNLSEESSGGDEEIRMSTTTMNVIKALSAGDETTAEKKGKDGFTFKNKAKLIFSINKSPKFPDAGHALKRRLLVIPFDHHIGSPDPRIEDKLLEEVPRIMTMLVRRIQSNVLENGGRFKVSRGSTATTAAQKKVLYGGSSVMDWAKECIESSAELGKDSYVEIEAAYDSYRRWCESNNYKHQASKPSFGRTLLECVISTAAEGSQLRRSGYKQVRVYNYTRFKEGVV